MNRSSAVLVVFTVAFASPAADPPKPKFKLGKDTTFVTEPLDKDGHIDYETALNERLRGKIKPDDNAVVLLVQAIGPKPAVKALPDDYFKRLGIERPPVKGEYFVPESKHNEQLTDDELAAFSETAVRLRREPWKAKEYPKFAEWLKANEKPLTLVIEASKKPAYYDPLVEREQNGERSLLVGSYGPMAVNLPAISSLLLLRAMNYLGEGRQADSWRDLIANFSLARNLSRSGTSVALMTSTALETDALQGILTWIETTKPSSAQLFECHNSLSKAPSRGSVAEVIGFTERIGFLDAAQYLARGLKNKFAGIAEADLKNVPKEKAEAIAKGLDWVVFLGLGNEWYDLLEKVQRIDNRNDRANAFEEIFNEERKTILRLKDESEVKKRIASGEYEELTKIVTERIGLTLKNILSPAGGKFRDATDRIEQQNRNLHLAFALAAYHADHKKYPATLADLTPKYIQQVPTDLFSGKPLVYKPSETGYLLYSVGVNGTDDGGKTYGDDPPGDDLRVRMPSKQSK